MAGSAETLQFEPSPNLGVVEFYPPLYLVQSSAVELETPPPAGFIDTDTIPELHFTRLRATEEAEKEVEKNRQLLRDGDYDSVPIPVDPLGTARRVVKLKQDFGIDSPQFQEGFAGLVLDSERLIGEAVRRNTWEYFEPQPQQLNPETELYMSHDVAVLDITTNGLTPIAEPEDVDRRINDHVGEHINHTIPKIRALGHLGLHGAVRVRGISECTDWAEEAYKTNPKGTHGGYVPAIKKLMVGDFLFDDSPDRYQDQIGVSGDYITRGVITTVLQQQGAIPEGITLTKTELHAKRFIGRKEDGVVNFVGLLDQEAGRVSGKNIFMGEEVAADHPKNYDGIVEEAAERRRKLAPKPLELANYLVALEENGTDRWASEALVGSYLKTMLLEVVKNDIRQAEIIFDKATASGLAEVAYLESRGDYAGAQKLLADVEKEAPPVSWCGAGSCGLEAVDGASSAATRARELGLGAGLIHDTERPCPRCHKMEVYYDEEGNKACLGCGSTHIKGKIKYSSQQTDQEQ